MVKYLRKTRSRRQVSAILHITLLTVYAAMSAVCSPAHLWCTVYLDVFNNQMITVQTLHTTHTSTRQS